MVLLLRIGRYNRYYRLLLMLGILLLLLLRLRLLLLLLLFTRRDSRPDRPFAFVFLGTGCLGIDRGTGNREFPIGRKSFRQCLSRANGPIDRSIGRWRIEGRLHAACGHPRMYSKCAPARDFAHASALSDGNLLIC